MADRKTGAGSMLSGVLERAPRPEPGPAAEVEDVEPVAAAKGRGSRPAKPPAARAAKKATGRTLYIDDDLWERIIVGAHRRKKTYSDYVVAILERNVPDHRVVRAGQGTVAAEQGEDAA